MPEEANPPKTFISYSWDSEQHKNNVLAVANTLRKPWGIETDIDQYVRAKPPYTPRDGWDLWMEKRIEWADFVLIVCTEIYKRRFRGDEEPGQGRGVTWEGTIIRQYLYNNLLRNTKFIPVVFSQQDVAHIPVILNSHDRYILDNEESFKALVYRLRSKAIVAVPEVAAGDLPPPSKPVFWDTQKPSIEPPPVSLDIGQIQAPIGNSPQPKLPVERPEPPNDTDDLSSERNIDYKPLRDLLKAGKWKEADQETAKRMLEVMGRQEEGWLRVEDIQQFPCTDLRTIDQLWVKYSDGKFGFSVQKKIWEECGSPMEYSNDWERFCDRVGWRKQGEWLDYSQLTFGQKTLTGELPYSGLWFLGKEKKEGGLIGTLVGLLTPIVEPIIGVEPRRGYGAFPARAWVLLLFSRKDL